MYYQQILETVAQEAAPLAGTGQVAAYIPELAKVPPERFGMYLITLDGQAYATGDAADATTKHESPRVADDADGRVRVLRNM